MDLAARLFAKSGALTPARVAILLFSLLPRWIYSRQREFDADSYGLELCRRAGFDLNVCLDAFNILTAYMLDHHDIDGVYGSDDQFLDPKLASNPLDWLHIESRLWAARHRRAHPSIRERRRALIDQIAATAPVNRQRRFNDPAVDPSTLPALRQYKPEPNQPVSIHATDEAPEDGIIVCGSRKLLATASEGGQLWVLLLRYDEQESDVQGLTRLAEPPSALVVIPGAVELYELRLILSRGVSHELRAVSLTIHVAFHNVVCGPTGAISSGDVVAERDIHVDIDRVSHGRTGSFQFDAANLSDSIAVLHFSSVATAGYDDDDVDRKSVRLDPAVISLAPKGRKFLDVPFEFEHRIVR